MPTSIVCDANTVSNVTMTLDEGETKLSGTLEVYKNNEYTQIAPVWIDLNDDACQRLRGRGGKADIVLIVPNKNNQQADRTIRSVSANENPLTVANQQGTVVAVLRVKKISSY